MSLIKISPDVLKEFYLECNPDEATPTLYFSSNRIIRWFFWQRLKVIIKLVLKRLDSFETCLDFGGGGGEFLPTLSRYFQKVVLLDLNTERASKVVKFFNLKNVVLEEKNVFHTDSNGEQFSLIVAADVLEHFREPEQVIKILKQKLNKDGLLITSLPTEGFTYVILRTILGIKKPEDHYFCSHEVELKLEEAGFINEHRVYLPLKYNIFALFSITIWKH